MMLYDIMQVEDDEDFRFFLRIEAKRQGMSHLEVGSLNDLEEALKDSSRAKVYVVDGKFPVDLGCQVEFLAPKAAEIIRNFDPESKIMFYSLSDLSYLAQKFNAEYAGKETLPRELIEKIKEMIEK